MAEVIEFGRVMVSAAGTRPGNEVAPHDPLQQIGSVIRATVRTICWFSVTGVADVQV